VTRFAATETTIIECHAAAECAAAVTHRHAAAVETSTAHTHAAVETAATATKAAAVATAATKAAATAAAVATTPTTPTATVRQRHCWRGQADRRNCQQRDHCLTQHSHSPLEIPLPTSTRTADGDRPGETLLVSTSPLLNSAREIKLKFNKRVVRAPLPM
jgi:hypothetical protein